ncbi:MAG TPA: sodium:proton antiporter, partial [Nannocystis sp.]
MRRLAVAPRRLPPAHFMSCLLAAAATCGPTVAEAAEAGGIDGRGLGVAWALPFAGVLLSIALGPLLVPRLWHHHYGKLAAFWAACAGLAV